MTVPVPPELDLSAAVLAARRADDRFACLEQPDRDGFVLAGLGQAAVLEARGAERFAEVAAAARELGRAAFADDPGRGSARARPPPGPSSWAASRSQTTAARRRSGAGLPPACLVLPEVTLVRQGGEARMTVSAACSRTMPPTRW